MPRGQKTCAKCGAVTGPRAFCCPSCHTHFVFKVQSREQKTTKLIKNFNWKELEKGDVIKVTGGPYFFYNGEPVSMGYRGKFIVEKLDEKGVCAWGIGKNTGFAHIYMGRDIQDALTGIWTVRHKLMKIKKKATVTN